MPVVAVGGPTASGKTAFSVQLAKRLGGEVVCADSMQIYKGLDVGTAKVTPEETRGVPHHCVDLLSPETAFSVADFTALAGRLVEEIGARGRLPILVGGTGLYVQSLLNGVRFTEEKAPDGLREALAAEMAARGPEAMYAELQAADPEAPTDVEEPVIRRTLRLKTPYMRDEGGYQDVSLCQTRLAAHGFPCGEVDGIYGRNTEWAVRSFQAYSGLDADGICGSKTWAALDGEPTARPAATAAGLVDFVKGQVGQVYVWGGHGQYNLTNSQIRSMDNSHANAQRSIDFIKKLKAKGVASYRCFDCSGLISRYFYDLGLVPSKRNCNHLASMCEAIHTPDGVSALEAALRPGDLVFRRNSEKYYHVGVYIGGGQVVEAKGRDDGVVQRRLDAGGGSYWNRWGRLGLLDRE